MVDECIRIRSVRLDTTHNLLYTVATLVATSKESVMPAIGIRQLKNDASEIIRTVREEKVEYIITLRGQPVAILRPIEPVVEDSDAILRLAGEVFADLDDDALAEVEAAIQRRPDFFADAELVAP